MTTMHERMGDHVATLPLGWFTGEKVGRLSRTATGGTMMVAGLFAHLLTPTVVGAVTPATIAVAMLVHDWRLGVAVLVCTPLLFLAFRTGARLVGRGDELDDAAAVAAGNRVVEFARTQRVLRAFGRGVEGYAPLDAALEHQRRVGRRSLWYAVVGMVLGGVCVQVVFTVLLAVGVLLAVSGQLAVGTAIALIALAARFTGPLAEVGDYAGTLKMARNDLRRLTSILDERALPEAADAAPLPEPGAVALEDVTFGYEPGRPVLRDVDAVDLLHAYGTSLCEHGFTSKDALVALDFVADLTFSTAVAMRGLAGVSPEIDDDATWHDRGWFGHKLEIMLDGLATRCDPRTRGRG